MDAKGNATASKSLVSPLVERLIDLALEEDRVDYDITALAAGAKERKATARLIAKSKTVIAGSPLAEMILSLKEPDDIVGCYKAYYQDLPVYLQQTITVVEARGELEFGCEAEDCSRWMMNEASFLNLWKGNKRLFFIARRSEFEALARRIPEFIYITLAENQGNVLVTNQKK